MQTRITYAHQKKIGKFPSHSCGLC